MFLSIHSSKSSPLILDEWCMTTCWSSNPVGLTSKSRRRRYKDTGCQQPVILPCQKRMIHKTRILALLFLVKKGHTLQGWFAKIRSEWKNGHKKDKFKCFKVHRLEQKQTATVLCLFKRSNIWKHTKWDKNCVCSILAQQCHLSIREGFMKFEVTFDWHQNDWLKLSQKSDMIFVKKVKAEFLSQ